MEVTVIRLLGGFHLYVEDRCADAELARSPKGMILLQRLLIAQGQTVPVQELLRILGVRSAGALKTLVSRTRALLSQLSAGLEQCVATAPGGYCWAAQEAVEVDFVRFEELCAALHDCHELTPVSQARFDAAISLYAGDLLVEHAHHDWVIGRMRSLQVLYLALVQRYLNILQEQGMVSEMFRVCRNALALLPFNEPLRLRLSDIMGQSELLDDPAMAQERLLRTGVTLDESIAALKKQIEDTDTGHAVVCDSGIFRDACRLTRRSLERMGVVAGLTLVMVSSPDGKPLHPVTLDLAVEDLVRLMAGRLRRGDVVSRISDDQVAALLPAAKDDTARLIQERIIRAFYEDHSPDVFLLTCRATTI